MLLLCSAITQSFFIVYQKTQWDPQGMRDLAIEMRFNKFYLWSIYEFYYMQPQRAINYKALKFEK